MVRWYWVNFQCRGVLLIWIIIGIGPIALAVGVGGGCLHIFFPHLSFLSSFSFSFIIIFNGYAFVYLSWFVSRDSFRYKHCYSENQNSSLAT